MRSPEALSPPTPFCLPLHLTLVFMFVLPVEAQRSTILKHRSRCIAETCPRQVLQTDLCRCIDIDNLYWTSLSRPALDPPPTLYRGSREEMIRRLPACKLWKASPHVAVCQEPRCTCHPTSLHRLSTEEREFTKLCAFWGLCPARS